MGADFPDKTKNHLKKSWDRQRVELCTADLLKVSPKNKTRTAAAEIAEGKTLKKGGYVLVRLSENGLLACEGNDVVAIFQSPTADLVNAVKESAGVAKGTIEQLHEDAGIAEISVC